LIPNRKTCFVKQFICSRWVVRDPCIGILGFVQRAFHQHCVSALLGKSEKDRFIDLASVNRQRECSAHPHILEEFFPGSIAEVQVGQQRQP